MTTLYIPETNVSTYCKSLQALGLGTAEIATETRTLTELVFPTPGKYKIDIILSAQSATIKLKKGAPTATLSYSSPDVTRAVSSTVRESAELDLDSSNTFPIKVGCQIVGGHALAVITNGSVRAEFQKPTARSSHESQFGMGANTPTDSVFSDALTLA